MSHPQTEQFQEAKLEAREELDGQYIQDFQTELREELSLKNYARQLRRILLDLLERYPERYSRTDYVEACDKAGITVF